MFSFLKDPSIGLQPNSLLHSSDGRQLFPPMCTPLSTTEVKKAAWEKMAHGLRLVQA